MRAGFQELMALAQRKGANAVLAESLHRFRRDQEDTAGFFKRLAVADVRITVYESGRTRGSEPPRPFRRLNGRHRFATLEA
jgi:DNA invertase Pin-like site-specific DNA recombinase